MQFIKIDDIAVALATNVTENLVKMFLTPYHNVMMRVVNATPQCVLAHDKETRAN